MGTAGFLDEDSQERKRLLENTHDINEYFDALNAMKDKCIIIVAVRNESNKYIRIIEKNELGLDGLPHIPKDHAYIGIVDYSADYIYEETTAGEAYYYYDGFDISSTKAWAQVQINDVNQAINSRGVNICVFDSESYLLVDSIVVDTSLDKGLTVKRY